MNNSSYAYAEVLEVLENMENVYVQKIPQKFIDFLKQNASQEYKKHITTEKPLKEQKLDEKTLNILALINLKYWVESDEHKKELIEKYKENEKKELERLSKEFDSSSIFENNVQVNTNDEEKREEEAKINSNNLPIERKPIFKRFVDYIKSKIFEN